MTEDELREIDADIAWWNDMLPPGWRLSGLTGRSAASFEGPLITPGERGRFHVSATASVVRLIQDVREHARANALAEAAIAAMPVPYPDAPTEREGGRIDAARDIAARNKGPATAVFVKKDMVPVLVAAAWFFADLQKQHPIGTDIIGAMDRAGLTQFHTDAQKRVTPLGQQLLEIAEATDAP